MCVDVSICFLLTCTFPARSLFSTLGSLFVPIKQLIKTRAEYEALLRENSDNLVVIKFFAPWCRSCKALDVKYRRMAVTYEDVKFVEVRKKMIGFRSTARMK